MTECLRLTDRMPAVALGQDEWTDGERQHLAGCSGCRREWELIRLTQGVGHSQLARFDSQGTARDLLLRLQRSRTWRRVRQVGAITGLGLAASLAALFWSRPAERSSAPAAPVAALEIPLPELDDLEPVELESVLSTMDVPLPADSATAAPELGDFDSGELETVLDIWEG